MRRRLTSRAALPALLISALVVRLVGITHGLPFSYNYDEELHFVPQAAQAADGNLRPGYYQNPSALTYLLAFVLRIRFVGESVVDRMATDPGSVWLVCRIVVALLGTLLVAIVWWAGRRYFGAAAGWIAGWLIAFGFLPVYYSHQALNDVPTLLPLTVALVGALLIYDKGEIKSFLLTGSALGAATGTKYLAAPFVVAIVVAVLLRVRRGEQQWRHGLALLCLAGVACIVTLLALNPYLVIDFIEARRQYNAQADAAATTKLGQTGTGWTYYPSSLLWGLGVVPVALALVGLVHALRTERAKALILVAYPVALYLHMASQGRFFGRWMLPIYPVLVILAGYGAVQLVAWVRRRGLAPRLSVVALPALAAVALAQPIADAVRSDMVLLQEDTRTQAHEWLVDHVPQGAAIVVEPSVPLTYLHARPDLRPFPTGTDPYLHYEETLRAELVDAYRRRGYCWVMVLSHQRDRGLAAGLEGAQDYYARLERESTTRAAFSPYDEGSEPPAFSFDFSFNWYQPSYERPGPEIEIRELSRCEDPRRS